MKKALPVRIEDDIQEKLKEEAANENRSLSNHVETILKNHVQKPKEPVHTPKKEYNDRNNNI